jgi:transcriptional regulator with XRE-family HTH domain
MTPRLRISEICDSLGITMGDLAEACGIPRPTLSAYNRGRRNPSLRAIRRIAESIGVRMTDLIDEENEEIDEQLRWFSKFSLEERLRYGLAHRKVIEHLRSFRIAKGAGDEKRSPRSD